MEHNDLKKKKLKDILFKVVTIIILGIIVFQLVQIRKDIKENIEAFDSNPLVFGANKYNLDSCACFIQGATVSFNKSTMWITRNKLQQGDNIIQWDKLI